MFANKSKKGTFMGLFNFGLKKAEPQKHKKVKIGLALGGGGVRGIAHIGVLKAFEEAGIVFDLIAGTSAGSLIGAMWAGGKSASEMLEIAKSLKVKDIRKSKFFMPSKTDGLESLVTENLGNIDINKLKIPFCAVAVDLVSSDEIVFSRGNVAKIVAGSCAVPGVFIPVEYEGMHLADGGLQNNIPSDVPRHFGCDYVVAVDVNSTRGEGTDSTKLLDVLKATIRIMSKSNCIKGYRNADVVIQPNMRRYSSTKVEDVDGMYLEGYSAGKQAVREILDIISHKQKREHRRRFAIISERKPRIL